MYPQPVYLADLELPDLWAHAYVGVRPVRGSVNSCAQKCAYVRVHVHVTVCSCMSVRADVHAVSPENGSLIIVEAHIA